MRGRALQPLVEGTATDWPKAVFIQISETHIGRAVRTRRWKYSVRAAGTVEQLNTHQRRVYVEDFLYDLENDPHERHNLVADPGLAGVRSELAARLKRFMAEAGEVEPRIESVRSNAALDD
jgi:arylsulfatase A-like enzyme